MILLYCLSVLMFGLASQGYRKTSQSIGTMPVPGTLVGSFYSLFGPLSDIGLTIYLIWGFFLFSWWVPIVVFFSLGAASEILFGRLQYIYGIPFTILGFPLGILFSIPLIAG